VTRDEVAVAIDPRQLGPRAIAEAQRRGVAVLALDHPAHAGPGREGQAVHDHSLDGAARQAGHPLVGGEALVGAPARSRSGSPAAGRHPSGGGRRR
jgi:hypothetical protein